MNIRVDGVLILHFIIIYQLGFKLQNASEDDSSDSDQNNEKNSGSSSSSSSER